MNDRSIDERRRTELYYTIQPSCCVVCLLLGSVVVGSIRIVCSVVSHLISQMFVCVFINSSCGIVLCSRDAKFAVDCDTCRLSYCLVCLASGSKDPCVRCGHRPSKRMEQLVHLRLKSIYKAFKQSSRTANGNSNNPNHNHKNSTGSTNQNQYHHHQGGDQQQHHHHTTHNTTTIEQLEDDDDVEDEGGGLSSAAEAYNDEQQHHQHQQQQQQYDHYDHYQHHEDNPIIAATKLHGQDVLTERFMKEKQKVADLAAQALLDELEEEEEAAKSKKSKKKRKKERERAKREEDRKMHPDECDLLPDEPNDKNNDTTKQQSLHSETDDSNDSDDAKPPAAAAAKGNTTPPPPPKDAKLRELKQTGEPQSQIKDSTDMDMDMENQHEKQEPETKIEIDPIEKKLCEMLEEEDIDGIEGILFELKGVPGRAALRKNAKKALKRLRSENVETDGTECQEATPAQATLTACELLKLVSDHNVPGKQPNRAECVMQMSPLVVGWVIGKGGQRIRDLMEESGAKVWIDQEKAKPDEARNVYISGDRKSVDQAVHMVKDIVSKAPVEGASKYAPAPCNSNEIITSAGNPQAPSEPVAAKTLHIPQQIDRALVAAKELPVKNPEMAAAPPIVPTLVPTVIAEVAKAAPPSGIDVVDMVEHVMTCEARFVPLLIGKRGWAIKDIQDKSGARVDIDQSVTPRQIRISGCKASVEKAIPMVRDVLNYPHAQPQPGAEPLVMSDLKQTTNEASPQDQLTGVVAALHGVLPQGTEDRYTPPPSSLIMTGDAKSMISASSSLSSTPEPSMASTSTSKGYPPHLPTGPLIPPEYGANHHMPPQASANTFLPQDMGMHGSARERGFGGAKGSPLYGGPGGRLMGMPNMPGVGMSPHHANHQQLYNQAPPPAMPLGAHMMQGQPPAGFSNDSSAPKNLHQGPGLDFMMSRNNAPMPMSHQQGAMNPHAPQYSHQFKAMPDNTMRNMRPPPCEMSHGAPVFESRSNLGGGGGLWNPNSGGPNYQNTGVPPASRLPQGAEGHFMDALHRPAPSNSGGQRAGAMPLGFDMGLPVGGQTAQFAAHNRDPTPNVLESGRDDSRMIDSLFGPAGLAAGNTNSGNQQATSLLTGLNGLSLNGDGLGSGGGSGLWGSSLSDWNSSKPEGAAVSDSSKKDPIQSSLLAGLQPLQSLPPQDQQQHHPPQSRFNWSSTNA
jgi:hypothetical protein